MITQTTENTYHVYPVNDLKEHITTGLGCKCGVRVILDENQVQVVTHSAYDKREYYEQLEDKGLNG